MIEDLLDARVQQFILDHAHDDERQLLLKYKDIHGVPTALIAAQIVGRRKAKIKLPVYFNTPGIVYPPGLSVEQSSSEKAAAFKADFLKSLGATRQTCADLTGGFGVDTFFLSKIFGTVHFVEPDEPLLAIARHDHQQLGATNIVYHATTAEAFLKSTDKKFDAIYIDPARRGKDTKKLFRLNECEPDITTLADAIFEKSNALLLKAAPLLDISQGLNELSFVAKVMVVAIDNECKEILFYCAKDHEGEVQIETVNLVREDEQRFSFYLSEEKDVAITYAAPGPYLYEPNAAILKAGAFKSIARSFGLSKLHSNTHLYTTEKPVDNFPGRVFKVEAFVKPDAKQLKKYLPDMKANITTRNYPMSVAELKKRARVKDGGEKFLIGFTGGEGKYLVVAEKV